MSLKKSKTSGLLTICKKAGKLTAGFDSVKQAMRDNKAFCVLVSSDISPKTLKEVMFFAEGRQTIIHTDITTDEFYFLLGKNIAVIAVCDEGFAKRFIEISKMQDAPAD